MVSTARQAAPKSAASCVPWATAAVAASATIEVADAQLEPIEDRELAGVMPLEEEGVEALMDLVELARLPMGVLPAQRTLLPADEFMDPIERVLSIAVKLGKLAVLSRIGPSSKEREGADGGRKRPGGATTSSGKSSRWS